MRITPIILLSFPGIASAATFDVAESPVGDQVSLASALASAVDGDTIRLTPGAYDRIEVTDGRTLFIEADGEGATALGLVTDGASTYVQVRGVEFTGKDGSIEVRGGTADLRAVTIDHIGTREQPRTAIEVGSGAVLQASNLSVSNVLSMRGAIVAQPQSSVTIEGAVITENESATDAGAIFVEGGTVRIADALIAQNTARYGGGAMAAIGGMIELDSTVFSANQSQTGGAVLATGSSNINAGDVEYDSNQADFGGHIFISGGQYSDARSAFIGGQGRLGGSIAVDGGKATFANAQITHSNAAEQGGAAYLADGQLSFNYAVVYDNQAPIGGGIAQAGGDLTIRGMIASENIGEAVASASGDVTFEHSLLWDNESFEGGTLGVDLGQTVRIAPPLFMGPEMGDFALKTGSPGIDAGVANQADLDGTPADIGVYGGPLAAPLADKDGDGFVYGRDCNDDDASIFPGADDRWYDGIDTNCDLFDDYDQDGDGFAAASFGGADCDDTNARIFPGAQETEGDLFDADCDGIAEPDADGDGWGSDVDCDDTNADVNPDGEDTWYDGIDQDCSGNSDYDQDGDGYDHVNFGGTDCDDTDAFRSPGTAEIAGDGIDQDCDGEDMEAAQPEEEASEVNGEVAGQDDSAEPSMQGEGARASTTTGCSTTGGAGGMGGVAMLAGLMGLALRRRD